MGIFLLNILLALAWAALLGEFSGINLLAGFLLGYFALWLGGMQRSSAIRLRQPLSRSKNAQPK